jgi:hypothetical protein
MRRGWFALVLVVFLFFATGLASANGICLDPSEYGNTSENPCPVTSCYDLQDIIYHLNVSTAEETEHYISYYNVTQNINCSDTLNWNEDPENHGSYFGFEPIGTAVLPFRASFEGNGFNISGLFINRSTTNYIGLFGYVLGGNISNINLVDVNITGQQRVGGLVGRFYSGNIRNSSVSGYIEGTQWADGTYVGGLVGGALFGNIYDSFANVTVVSVSDYAGGLVGGSGGLINNSHSFGNITALNYYLDASVGGLAGVLSVTGRVNYSYSSVTANGYYAVGGLVGSNLGKIDNSNASGAIDCWSQYGGGLVGSNEGNITNSFATGNVITDSNHMGGLVGVSTSGIINNSYATGNVNGSWRTGGLVGAAQDTSIYNSYSTGNVTGIYSPETPDKVGGFIGGFENGVIDNCSASGNVIVDCERNCAYIGGFAGYLAGGEGSITIINNSYATGRVVSSASDVGGFAGRLLGSESHIDNSYAAGNVSGWYTVGGLVGESSGYILNSYATGRVDSENYEGEGDPSNAGGLVGYNHFTISNSYATGDVNATKNNVGGLVGYSDGDILSSYATGDVNAIGNNVGGLAGYLVNEGEGGMSIINNSYFIGNVSGIDYVGGLVGYLDQDNVINNSYSEGEVSGVDDVGGLVGSSYYSAQILSSHSHAQVQSTGNNVGGLVGILNYAAIAFESYATGNVTGVAYVGGFAGFLAGIGAQINSSYSTGNVTGAGSYVGGFVGQNSGDSIIRDCYSTGNVLSILDSEGIAAIGGFAGENDGDIYTSYSTGNVTASSEISFQGVGGFVGQNGGTSVYSSYSTGNATASTSGSEYYLGGFIGFDGLANHNSGWVIIEGLGPIGSDSEAVVNYSETFASAFFNYSHGVYTDGDYVWDFDSVWDTINDTINYPVFRWQTGNIKSVSVSLVSPANDVNSSGSLSFIFNTSTYLAEQEISYCNLSVQKLRMTEIPSTESGLLGLWHFNNNLVDSSGDGDGTANGGEFSSDYKFGSASYLFNGTQNIFLPEDSVFTSIDNFTVSAWIRLDNSDNYNSILAVGGGGDEFLFDIYGGKINFYSSAGSGSADTTLSLDQWYHVVAVRMGDKVYFYLNGNSDGDMTLNNADPIIPSTSFRAIGGDIGTVGEGSGENFEGNIDELAIWNRALSSFEIEALYSQAYTNSSSLITKDVNQTLFLNLSSGNYTWSVSCTDDAGVVGTSETRDLTVNGTSVEDTSESETQTNQTTPSSYSPKTYFSDVKLPTEGNKFNLRHNDKIKFVVQQNNHTLTMQNFNSTHARVKIESEPIITWIEKDVLYEFDLNNDSIKDVRVRYGGINSTSRQAMMFIQEIVLVAEESLISSNVIVDFEDRIIKKNNYLIWIILFVVLLMVVFLKNKKKIEEYLCIKKIERSRKKSSFY